METPSSIIGALDDPALFGPLFADASWGPWRTFLRALFALPLDDAELELFARCTGRTAAPTEAFREAALICGRRGGKSRVLALIAVYLACFRDYTPFLAPGEMATVAILAANRSQARSIFRYVLGALEAVPLLAPMIEDKAAESITLANRVSIEISTASFRTTRGYSFAAILCDEIAFWRQDESSANPDTEILRALRPGMANIPGGILMLASSPYAKRGELHATYRRHFGKADGRVLVWKADTATMNPRIDPAIIAEAYETDPEAARAEYGAEFRDDLADFVTREVVDAVTAFGCIERTPDPAITYTAFCDPSGGASDAMTLAIAHLTPEGVAVLDAVREARPPFDPEGVVRDFAATLRSFGISRVIGDRYGGMWPRQRFSEAGIEYEASARPKSDLYIDLLPLLNAKRVELLDAPRLSAQLVGLERRTARSGRDSVDHTPGGHDDLANAVAGVLVGLDLDRRPSLVRTSDLLHEGAPIAEVKICDTVFAAMAIDKHGQAAAIFAAKSKGYGVPLVILDFETGPLSRAMFVDARARLLEFARLHRARYGALAIFGSPALVRQGASAGVPMEEVPAEMEDIGALTLAVSGHVGAGKVKLGQLAHERSLTSPFAGALDFRVGDVGDDPLRAAAVLAVAIALEGG